MAETARELLAQYEQEDSARDLLARYDREDAAPDTDSWIDSAANTVARPFNKGIMNLLGLLPGGDSLRADATNLGMLSPEGQEAEGIVPRSMEILGGSAIPGGIIQSMGRQVLGRTLPQLKPVVDAIVHAPKPLGVLPGIAAQTAASPGITAATELAGAFGGGAGGEIAAAATDDDPYATMIGELLGGITGVAGPQVVKGAGSGLLKGADVATEALAKVPFVGAPVRIGRDALDSLMSVRDPWRRASGAARETVVDPEAAAARIDPNDPMPPARQVGEPRMLATEEALRRSGSAADAEKVTKHIADTVDAQKQLAIDTGGDTTLPAKALEQSGDSTIQRFKVRAETAANDAETAIKDLDVDEPWNISAAARAKLEEAKTAGRELEREAWGKVGWESPGTYDNAQAAVDELATGTGRALRDEVVPKFIRDELATAAKDGATLQDIHALRQKVGTAKGQAQTDGDRAMYGALAKLETALLKDMESVSGDPAALKAAREATKEFYDKFGRGKLGQVLGYSERSVLDTAPEDTLNKVFSGTQPARDLEQMLSASPAAMQDAMDYQRKLFLTAAYPNGKFNLAAANRFIGTLRQKRILDVLPELEGSLVNATSKSGRAEFLTKYAKQVEAQGGVRAEKGTQQSLASMYNEGPVGREAGLLLDSKKVRDPVTTARKLRTKMRGDEAAETGLRQSFKDAMWEKAKGSLQDDGTYKYSPGKFTKLVNDNIQTMEALGFKPEEIQDLRKLSTYMQQAAMKAEPAERVLSDLPGLIVSSASQVLGARTGNWINKVLGGKGAGPGLQAAQLGSQRAKQLTKALRVDPAESLLRDAMDDPALLKALLIGKEATETAKKQAASKLNAWAIGAGLSDDGESEP